MKRKIYAGTTSVELPIFVRDSTSSAGAGLGGLAYNSGGLVAEYRRQGQATWQAITLVAGTLGTYAAGAFIADGALAGAYTVCPPDAAFLTGARWVTIRLRGATNMAPVLIEIELDAVNYQNAASFGLTNLDATISSVATAVAGKPNAAQVAAAILVNTANKIATDNAGAIALPATAPAGYGGSGGGGSDPWTTAIPGSYTSGQAGAILGAIKTAIDQVINAIGKAQITGAVNDGGPTQSSFVMGGTAATRATVADCYKLAFLEFTGGSNQGIARKILTVNTSTKVVTFATPFPFPVANTDTFTIQGVSE